MFSAEFFDIFGIIVFAFLLFIGIKLKNQKKVKPWVYNSIIVIALLGLVVNLYIVFSKYVF